MLKAYHFLSDMHAKKIMYAVIVFFYLDYMLADAQYTLLRSALSDANYYDIPSNTPIVAKPTQLSNDPLSVDSGSISLLCLPAPGIKVSTSQALTDAADPVCNIT